MMMKSMKTQLYMFRDLASSYPFSVINALSKEQHLGVFQRADTPKLFTSFCWRMQFILA